MSGLLPTPPTEEQRAFLEAAKRACEIYEGADAPQTPNVARAVGTTTERLVTLAGNLRDDLLSETADARLSPRTRELVLTTDVLAIGILIGRELGR